MSFGLRNWKRPTPLKVKLIGDMCVYSLPLWQGLILSAPFSDDFKSWANFGIGVVLVLAKSVTKLFSISEENENHREHNR